MAAPECPRPGHKNSRVWRYGTDKRSGHPRPRWRCVPANGDPPHEFRELLPRQTTAAGFCIECERDYGHHEGPQSARGYSFALRDIAATLMRVGQGASYREAAFFARSRASRWPVGHRGRARHSTHGQMVCDWVEVFAPVVYEPRRDWAWPAVGSLLLDELPFRINNGVPGGLRSFSVLAAMGYDPELKRMRLWRLEAVPTGTLGEMRRAWERFLRSLTETPARVVCDQDRALTGAVRAVWPATHVHHCELHLRVGAYSKLKDVGLHVAGTPLYDAVERAFTSQAGWDTFKQLAVAARRRKLTSYVRRIEPVVIAQLPARPRYSTTADPYTTGALEERLHTLRQRLAPRAGRLTNRERLNRALLLMQLDLNGQATELAYACAIHDWLLANGGRPRGERRALADAKGTASLRP